MRSRVLLVFLLAAASGCSRPGPDRGRPLATVPASPPPIGAAASEPAPASVPAGVVAHDANDFTFDVLHTAAPASGNFLFSGFVARHAIGTLAAASPDRDAALKALHYPASVDQPGRAEQSAWRRATSHLTFTSGARVFYEQSQPLSNGFAKEATDRFDETFEALDFQANSRLTRHRMGEWVGETTGGQLTGDISENAVPKGTTLAIGAAFGLEAPWTDPFNAAATADGPFTFASGVKHAVKMMHQTASAAFAQMADGTKLVDLSLGAHIDDREGLSVLVVLPPRGTKLRAVEARLDRALYDSWQSELEVQRVHIELPRFHIKEEFELTSFALDVAPPDASHVFEDGTIPRVRFVEGAVVTVDEGGVKAAAATLGTMTTAARGAPTPIPEFIANRPFLFFIHDRTSATKPILLFGRIEKPTE